MIQIGVDIGGNHISAAQVVCTSTGVKFNRYSESKVPSALLSEALIEIWASVIAEAMGKEKIANIGIAMPGPFDYAQGISQIKDQGKMRPLYQKSVRILLAEALSLDPSSITFRNDAEAFLLGESRAGVARDLVNCMGITLGTGLGSAIKIQEVVRDAKLWRAPFRGGIAEDFLGTAWFIYEAQKRFGLQLTGVKGLLESGADRTMAQDLFRDFGRALGEFLLPYLIRMQIEGVILGGKVSLASDEFLKYTQEYLVFNGCKSILLRSSLGEKAALLGSIDTSLE